MLNWYSSILIVSMGMIQPSEETDNTAGSNEELGNFKQGQLVCI